MSKVNQTNCGAEGPLVPGGMALRLFIRDATGIPTAINLQAYWAALRDRDFLTCGTAERIREIESVLDQVSPEDASLLLLCASDVAMAADRYMEAEILREASLSEALEMDPSVDPETREFLDSLASWPSRDTPSRPKSRTRSITVWRSTAWSPTLWCAVAADPSQIFSKASCSMFSPTRAGNVCRGASSRTRHTDTSCPSFLRKSYGREGDSQRIPRESFATSAPGSIHRPMAGSVLEVIKAHSF